jgi:adenosylcobinamide-GDP ribazoletransferase
MFAAAVAAHAIGRGASVAVMRLAPSADHTGLGADYTRGLSTRGASAGVLAALGIGALATGWWVGPLALGAVVGGAAVVRLAVRKIGGISGDVLGAVEQVTECLCLVIATGLAAHHTLWWS